MSLVGKIFLLLVKKGYVRSKWIKVENVRFSHFNCPERICVLRSSRSFELGSKIGINNEDEMLESDEL